MRGGERPDEPGSKVRAGPAQGFATVAGGEVDKDKLHTQALCVEKRAWYPLLACVSIKYTYALNSPSDDATNS